MNCELVERPLDDKPIEMPAELQCWVNACLQAAKKIDCFDYVPSDATKLYRCLAGLPRGRFCEWGSGVGIGVGLATALGFEAIGVELNAALAALSQQMLHDGGLQADIVNGSYFESPQRANLYFVYCWPGQLSSVEQLFREQCDQESQLLIAHGAEDLRLKTKPTRLR